jgi:hypothetical protein
VKFSNLTVFFSCCLIYTQVRPYFSPWQIFIKINIPLKLHDIKNIDINEITEEHLFLGIYDTILMY